MSGGIFLARHGETAYNAEKRFQGHLPVPLSERGRAQAAELAEAAAAHGFAALWCSPLRRARETAEIVGARIGLEPHPDAAFAETDAGDWTDVPWAEVERRDPDRFAAYLATDAGFAFPGGESFAHQADRVAAGLERVRAAALPALVVCHRQTMRLALAVAHGADAERRRSIPNGALVEL